MQAATVVLCGHGGCPGAERAREHRRALGQEGVVPAGRRGLAWRVARARALLGADE